MSDINDLVNDITDSLKKTVEGLHFNEDVETVPTGIDLFDTILGGGIPIGKMVLLTGSPGVGKSSLAANAIAALHRAYPDSMAFYLDAEQAMTTKRLTQLGVDPKRTVLISQDLTLEKVSRIVVQIVSWRNNAKYKKAKDIPIFIVWDSESATMTEKQLSAEEPSKVLGQKASMLSLIIPQLANIANKHKITFFIIGQLRDKIDLNPYAPKGGDLKGLGDKKITGGNVMKYHPFQIIHGRPKTEIDPAVYGYSGVVSEIKIIKNKLFTPNIKIEMVLDYMNGYSDFWTKERLIRACKGIKGTSWQYLEGYPDVKFRKSTIKEKYETDEKFKEKFEELYEKFKGEISAFPNASEMIMGDADADDNDDDKNSAGVFEELEELANYKENGDDDDD
jgi:RecA/RadA recombinase